jgi:hypothetical protein
LHGHADEIKQALGRCSAVAWVAGTKEIVQGIRGNLWIGQDLPQRSGGNCPDFRAASMSHEFRDILAEKSADRAFFFS